MKKAIIFILLLIFVGLTILGVVVYRQSSILMSNNTEVVEQLIHNTLPEGYTPLMVEQDPEFKSVNAPDISTIALLLAPDKHSIFIAKGPKINNKKEEQQFISAIQLLLQKYSDKKYENEVVIVPAKEIHIEGVEYSQYKIEVSAKEYNSTGIAVFLNDKNASLFVTILAPSDNYEEKIARQFLETINIDSSPS
jgi:hypothetical protein